MLSRGSIAIFVQDQITDDKQKNCANLVATSGGPFLGSFDGPDGLQAKTAASAWGLL